MATSRRDPSVVLLLCLQLLAFVAGALTHFGVVFSGLAHRRAAIAETVIAAVLLAGICGYGLAGRRMAALAAQTFALLGTLLGAVMIWIGIGPRTGFDLALHAVMLALLAGGLVLTRRLPRA